MKGAYHLCQMTCRCRDGWGYRNGRSGETYRDEDTGCYLLQLRSHRAHPALLYMHSPLRTLMMSMPYPPY